MVERDGERVPYRGLMAKRAQPPEEAFVILAPGERVSRVVDFAAAYAVEEPGAYRLRFARPLLDLSVASGGAFEELDPLRVESDWIEVRVE